MAAFGTDWTLLEIFGFFGFVWTIFIMFDGFGPWGLTIMPKNVSRGLLFQGLTTQILSTAVLLDTANMVSIEDNVVPRGCTTRISGHMSTAT